MLYLYVYSVGNGLHGEFDFEMIDMNMPKDGIMRTPGVGYTSPSKHSSGATLTDSDRFKAARGDVPDLQMNTKMTVRIFLMTFKEGKQVKMLFARVDVCDGSVCEIMALICFVLTHL